MSRKTIINSFLFKNRIFKRNRLFLPLPEFPKFKSLELSDEKMIKKITSRHPPYSDFNFVSMWSWGVKGDMRISQLYGNLVVRFTDYLTGKPFYSFLGDNKVNETASALLQLSKKENIEPKLKLVPHNSITGLDKRFCINEDKDNFDYIYDLSLIDQYKGNLLEHHRRSSRKFREYNEFAEVKYINIYQKDVQKDITSVFDQWVNNKKSTGKDVDPEHEREAIRRIFLTPENTNNIVSIGIFNNGNMIGFAINELLNSGFSINHFIKADIGNQGVIFSYLMQENARSLMKNDSYYLNFEQDLGLPGLRQSKRSFRPIYFLKKYEVTLSSL